MAVVLTTPLSKGDRAIALSMPKRLRDKPIEGPYPELARLVREVLGDLSARVAARRSGVNYLTISNMAQGERGSMSSIIRFANGFRRDPNPLLIAAGWPAIDGAQSQVEMAGADPLSLVGPDVDISPLAAVPHAFGSASASTERQKEASDDPYATFGIEALPGDVRSIRVDGDCMEPLYCDGDVLFVQETDQAANGDTVIALLDNFSVTCKVYRTNGKAYLEPTNGEGKIEAGRFRIVGVVVGYYRRMKRR